MLIRVENWRIWLDQWLTSQFAGKKAWLVKLTSQTDSLQKQLDSSDGLFIPASEASCGIGVQGVANSVVSCLSPPRGLRWEKFWASGKVKVDAQNVLH